METMESRDVMREARAAGLADQIYAGRILLWGGLALTLLSAMACGLWLTGAGVLFAGIGAWIIRRVLKSLPTASSPP
jgi:hypothetical protein